jgi:isopentenyl phosphate kinase
LREVEWRVLQVVVLGGGSFGTAVAAHVAAKKADLEVAMLLRDDLVCRSINNTHINWLVTSAASFLNPCGGILSYVLVGLKIILNE